METVQVCRGVTVVELGKHYDAIEEDATRRLDGLLRGLSQSAEPPLVVLDMSETTSISSTFVGAVFGGSKRFRQRGGRIALCNPDPFCAEVLRVVRADAVLKTFSTRELAIDNLTSNLASK